MRRNLPPGLQRVTPRVPARVVNRICERQGNGQVICRTVCGDPLTDLTLTANGRDVFINFTPEELTTYTYAVYSTNNTLLAVGEIYPNQLPFNVSNVIIKNFVNESNPLIQNFALKYLEPVARVVVTARNFVCATTNVATAHLDPPVAVVAYRDSPGSNLGGLNPNLFCSVFGLFCF